jgi:hypothetical protein
VVRETLLSQAAVRAVILYPAPHDVTPELELNIRVDGCGGVISPDGTAAVHFVAEWSVRSNQTDGKLIAAGRFVPAPTAWDGRDPAALAQALGAAATGLANEIAAALAK